MRWALLICVLVILAQLIANFTGFVDPAAAF